MSTKRRIVSALLLAFALAITGIPTSAASITIITMDRTRTKADIVAMAKKLAHSGFNYDKVAEFSEEPALKSPYTPGSIATGDIQDALNAIKMIRYIAGLPYESIKLTPELNGISQHGAVLLAATGQFCHNPTQPADMNDGFFSLGYKGCSEANLYKGSTNISYAVLGFTADPGGANISTAAHRRWLLKPGAENFGVGYAGKVTSLYVFDGLGPYTCEADTYIAWPNAGDFPIEYFINSSNTRAAPSYPWSVNLGAEYSAPAKENITITLTRKRDNKTWIFDKTTPDLGKTGISDNSAHFSVDNSGYGICKAIIFRPDVTSLGQILDGDEFDVEINGIKTNAGADTLLCYTVRFFSLGAELAKEKSPVFEYTKGALVSERAISGAALTVVPYYSHNGETALVKMSTVTADAAVLIAPETAAYSFNDNAKTFDDISGNWSKENIEFVTSRELFLGASDGVFNPNGTMTRAMFVAVLARLHGISEEIEDNTQVFSDVASGRWFSWAVSWAYENGIISGVGNNMFAPDSSVTREQMAQIIARYAEFAGYELRLSGGQLLFEDDSEISDWGREAVYTLQRAGIVSGKPGNIYDPGGCSTRAEAGAVLKRFIEAVLLG